MSSYRRPQRRGSNRFAGTLVFVLLAALGSGVGLYLLYPDETVRALPEPVRALLPLPSTDETPAADPAADAPAVAEAPPPDLPPGGLFVGEERVAVLMYHDVTDQPSVYFDITPAAFRFHLETLRRAGANVVSLADLYDHLRSGKLLPPRSVVLTFDDTYSGQLTHAYPLLKQYGYPATFFVHTGVIGRRTSRDHMTWEQLQALDEEGLVRVEAHTESHPDDLRKLTDEELQRELVDSKKLLEERLGKQIRFLAYPVGNADGRVAQVTREAGYEMAFTMGPGMASSPADAYFVPRLLPTRIPEVLEGWREERVVPVARSEVVELKVAPLDQGELKDGQVKLQYIRGGKLSSLRLLGRRDVPRMVRMAGAAAGLNGTFFSDARVNSAGNGIVGPVLSRFGPGFAPGLPGDREKIAGRPLVMIGPNQMAFLPFQPHLMLDETGVERLLPGTTDAFVAGAWLVHRGNPVTKEAMETFGLTNIFDFRPRAFLGVDRAGRPFLGASSTGNQSDRLAETLMKLDLQECVLLDSGFSTSLVSGKEVLVTGIRRKNMEARPVPHVLVLHPVDEATGKEQLVVDPLPAGAWGPPYVPTLERLQAALQQDLPSLVQDETWNRRSGRRGRRGRGRRR